LPSTTSTCGRKTRARPGRPFVCSPGNNKNVSPGTQAGAKTCRSSARPAFPAPTPLDQLLGFRNQMTRDPRIPVTYFDRKRMGRGPSGVAGNRQLTKSGPSGGVRFRRPGKIVGGQRFLGLLSCAPPSRRQPRPPLSRLRLEGSRQISKAAERWRLSPCWAFSTSEEGFRLTIFSRNSASESENLTESTVGVWMSGKSTFRAPQAVTASGPYASRQPAV